MGKSIRVGFIYHEGMWLGGLNYWRNLFSAVRLLPNASIVPVIISAIHSDVEQQFSDVEIIRTYLLERKSPAWILRKGKSRLLKRDTAMVNLLLEHGIQVLSHSGHLGRQCTVPTVGWIPDLQHIYLPSLFSAAERRDRDSAFKNQCQQCTRVIVSSYSAQADLEKFYPGSALKTGVLRFVAGEILTPNGPSLKDLENKYQFRAPYFLLPNQFWAHKNHIVVINALNELRKSGERVVVIATGPTNDHRNPKYFSSLIEYARQHEVLEFFRVLGPIPYTDLVALMKNAMAIINSSKFEGWSTSVEEAKSIGKQVVLSDIPVHREQAPPLGAFFNPDDCKALADLLVATAKVYDRKRDCEEQAKAVQLLPERRLDFARAYQRIISNALDQLQTTSIARNY